MTLARNKKDLLEFSEEQVVLDFILLGDVAGDQIVVFESRRDLHACCLGHTAGRFRTDSNGCEAGERAGQLSPRACSEGKGSPNEQVTNKGWEED